MKQNKNFVLRHIYGKYILIPVRTNSTSSDPILLNDVAAKIWNASPQASNTDHLLNIISSFYNLPTSSPEQTSVHFFIKQMSTMGLISDNDKEA